MSHSHPRTSHYPSSRSLSGAFRSTLILGSILLLGAASVAVAEPAQGEGLPADSEPPGDPGEEVEASVAQPLSPPDYGVLSPPEEGETLVDPVFATPVLRLTDAKRHRSALMTHDYARSSALNDDDTLVLIHDAGQYMVFTSDGRKLTDLPNVAGKYAEPRWLHGEPSTIVYLAENRVMRLDVRTLESEEIVSFPEYSRVYSGEEQDISEDGAHFALIGQQGGKDVEAFVLNIRTGDPGPRLDLRNAGRTINWVAVSPDNELVVAWNRPFGTGRFQGVELYDRQMNFVRQLAPWMSHGDICRSADGEVLYVQSNAASSTPFRNEHWMVGHRFRDGAEIPLQKLTWAQVPHVSCNQPGPSEWALISLYVPENPSASSFVPFDNEVYLLALDGTQRVRRLLHHRSRPLGGSYFYESRASGSRSGKYVVFSSNFGRSATGNANYTDAYLAPLPVKLSPAKEKDVIEILERQELDAEPGDGGEDKLTLLELWEGDEVKRPVLLTDENRSSVRLANPDDTDPWVAPRNSCASAGESGGPTPWFAAFIALVGMVGRNRIRRPRAGLSRHSRW